MIRRQGASVPGGGERWRIVGFGARGLSGWPRAAWFVRGMGRWGVEDVSEAPESFGAWEWRESPGTLSYGVWGSGAWGPGPKEVVRGGLG